jgi:ribonucleoside-diphosphate reductase alpha chain
MINKTPIKPRSAIQQASLAFNGITNKKTAHLRRIEDDQISYDIYQNKYALPLPLPVPLPVPITKHETPTQTYRRISKNLLSAIKNNHIQLLEYLQTQTDQTPSFTNDEAVYQTYLQILNLLSPFGNDLFTNINQIDDLVHNSISFDKIIPGGSVICGLGNEDTISSLSNCFVIDSPYDSYEGINHAENEMTLLMKNRGGVGVNISTIRPRGAKINNQSKISSGACIFASEFAMKTSNVSQNSRRGALMICMDVRHPDIEEFIDLKANQTSVTSANISVLIDDEFMQAVKNDTNYLLTFPVDFDTSHINTNILEPDKLSRIDSEDPNHDIYVKLVSAKKIWNKIIFNAHKYAEPGIIYKSNMINYGTDSIYPQYKFIATNPCAEIGMQANDSCRLVSSNLKCLVKDAWTPYAEINYEKAYIMFYLQMLYGDALVDLEILQLQKLKNKCIMDDSPEYLKHTQLLLFDKLIENAENGRRCGCGIFGLCDLMAMTGLSFHDIRNKKSKTYKALTKLFDTKVNAELDCSVDLAILYGAFEGYNPDEDYKQAFFHGFSNQKILDRMKEYGRRNVSWSTVPPTGSLSTVAGTTSAIEPLFEPFYTRRVKVDPSTDPSTEQIFTDKDGQKFINYLVIHSGIIEWYAFKNHQTYKSANTFLSSLSPEDMQEIYKKSPYYKQASSDIDPLDRLALQQIVQKRTTHSISSTINLPEDTTKETIDKIYRKSYDLHLKGNTVYRAGSRSGVLVATDTKKHRPKILKAVMHKLKYRNRNYGIILGFTPAPNPKPLEIFIVGGLSFLNGFSREVFNGTIEKDQHGDYNFLEDENDIKTMADYDEGNFIIILNSMNDMEVKEEKVFSLFVSKMLRSNIDLAEIIKLIKKAEPLAHTFTARIIKILSTYLETKETGEKCPACGEAIIMEAGCEKCRCGWSRC